MFSVFAPHTIGDARTTYLKAFVEATGGVPVREDAPESSPGRPKPPPGARRRPLLLRELNIDVGPNDAFVLGVRVAEPLRRRRSSEPIWFCRAWLYAEKFLASPRPACGRPPPGPLWWLRALSAAFWAAAASAYLDGKYRGE